MGTPAAPIPVLRVCLDWLFPPRCQACRRLHPTPLCPTCRAAVALAPANRCQRCGEFLDPLLQGVTVCRECRGRKRDPLAAARAAAPYEGVVRRLIHHLKYHRRRQAVAALHLLLAEWLRSDAEAVFALGLAEATALVPVPLHRWRRWRRGFNQAELLCAGLAAELGLPVLPALLRTRPTRPQVGLDPVARRRNVRGAFGVDSAQLVPGATYVLVDDVYTTGATLRECAGALRRAGAGRVVGLTVAHRVARD